MLDPVDLISDPARQIVKEKRPLQVALTKYLQSVLGVTPAVAEAGTGIGKSFGYTLPAIAAVEKGMRVVISTGMKSLQQQLMKKDLPYLASRVMPGLKYAQQVGKKNYGCKRQVYLNVFDKKEIAAYNTFFDTVPHWIWDHAPKKLEAQLPRNKHNFSVAYCNKTRCPFHSECAEHGYLAAKAEIADADILVVNHALLGAEIRTVAQHDTSILGDKDFQIYIVDEAHKFPENVRKALAYDMPVKFFSRSSTKYEQLLQNVELEPAYLMNEPALAGVPRSLPGWEQLEPLYKAMHIETQRRGTDGFGETAHHFARAARAVMNKVTVTTGAGLPAFGRFLAGSEDTNGVPLNPSIREIEPAMQLLYFLHEYVNELHKYTNAIDLATAHRLKYVTSVEMNEQTRDTTIQVMPIDLAPDLAAHYAKKGITPAYLSATLAIGDNFEHFARDVGHGEEVESDYGVSWETPPGGTFQAGTPFNFEKQAYGYYPSHLPDVPQGKNPSPAALDHWRWQVALECKKLLEANEGHAFILFTSTADMEALYANLKKLGYRLPLLKQSEELKSRGREIFTSTPNATLLGLKSFWEGIDVPGMHLTLVIIPKLPFPASDPIIAAKMARAGDEWFTKVSLPHMLMDLRQMAGRLIRSTEDRGVLAVLDRRIYGQTKNYSQAARNAIGYPRFGSSQEQALKFLRKYSELRREANHQPIRLPND